MVVSNLDDGFDVDAEQAWADEIQLRIQEMESGQAKMVPWEEAMKMIMEDDVTKFAE